MRKTLTTTNLPERSGLRVLAAVAITGTLAAFGCTTNRTPGYGEPAMSTPAAGAIAPNSASTPGSANTMGRMPQASLPPAMISSSPANGESASLDALAAIKADEAFRGKVLGPAAPGDNGVAPASMQQVTGQFISPSLYANPQTTVNSSISSAPTPAIVSGAAGDTGGVAVITGGTAITAGATLSGVQNVGTTGVSSTTATPIANGTTANTALPPAGTATLSNAAIATNNQVIGTGMANAPAPASNAVATPILTTVGPLGQVNAATGVSATGASTLGVTNVAPATVTATPTVRGTVVAPAATSATTNGVGVGVVANTSRLNTSMATPVTANVTVAPAATAVRTRAVRAGTTASATAGVRVVSANGQVVVTNQSQSALQRFLTTIGLRRNVTAGVTANPNP